MCGHRRVKATDQFSTAKCFGQRDIWLPKSSAGVMKLPTSTQKKGNNSTAERVKPPAVIHQRGRIPNVVIGGERLGIECDCLGLAAASLTLLSSFLPRQE